MKFHISWLLSRLPSVFGTFWRWWAFWLFALLIAGAWGLLAEKTYGQNLKQNRELLAHAQRLDELTQGAYTQEASVVSRDKEDTLLSTVEAPLDELSRLAFSQAMPFELEESIEQIRRSVVVLVLTQDQASPVPGALALQGYQVESALRKFRVQLKQEITKNQHRLWLARTLPVAVAVLGILSFLFGNRLRKRMAVASTFAALAAEDRWKKAVAGPQSGTWAWSRQTDKMETTPIWWEQLGYPESLRPASVSSEEWLSFVHPEDRSRVFQALDAHISGSEPRYLCEFRMRRFSGDWAWIRGHGIVVEREGEIATKMQGLLTDITEEKQTKEITWRQAHFDSLTGVANRRTLLERLQLETRRAARQQSPMALVLVDMDRFKRLNEMHGYSCGDKILESVARRLQGCVREDDLVARVDGDEFALVLADCGEVAALTEVLGRVAQAVSEPFVNQKKERICLSASIGVAVCPGDSLQAGGLLGCAEHALESAKKGGGSRYQFFTRQMQEEAQTRCLLSRDLQRALGTDQVQVLFQPIVDLKTQAVYKAEALALWRHPVQGLVPAAEFIPVAESTGALDLLSNQVLADALGQTARWRQLFCPDFQVSVNLSPSQLYRTEHASAFRWSQLLAETGLPGDALLIEITESSLLDTHSAVLEQLSAYQQAGVALALDDFGTGYSAFAYLQRYQMDYLKIDRSFVQGLAPDSRALQICHAIVRMAHALGIQVVAEGVETAEQARLLTELGCDYGQGFYWGRPVSAREFEMQHLNLQVIGGGLRLV